MKKFKIKNTKLFLAILILLLILSSLGYAYIFYTSYARNEFFQTSLKIANQNQNSVFRVSKILLYSSANAIDNSENNSLQNLSICQYTDIALSIDNTSYISDLTTTNTVKELYIDNIEITTNAQKGKQLLNYKNLNNFGNFEIVNSPDNGRIDFNIVQTNEQNDTADYSTPTFYADCSNPISLGYLNRDIVENFSISEQTTSLSFNGKLLQQANVNLDEIGYVINFDIHIKNYDNDNFTYHATINSNLNDSNNNLYSGYLYQAKTNTSGSEYDFFKELN